MRSVTPILTSLAALAAGLAAPAAFAAPCLEVTLTGTGGPPPTPGLAGPGTLVTYGDEANGCREVLMQFDAGRGTVMRMADVGVLPQDMTAVFVTHIHSDHVEGLSDLVQMRWMYGPDRPKLDVLCPADAASGDGSYTASCTTLVTHIDDAYELSGETAVRLEEMPGLDPGGAVARLNILSFENRMEPHAVWQSGDVTVSAVGSFHIPGHASYRVNSPAGSVVISGDTASSLPVAERVHSTSDELEAMAQGADVLVHAAIHPALSPDALSGMPEAVYYRQSNATDIGAMAARAGVGTVMLTHLGPALGAAAQGPWVIPGGPLDAADFDQAVRDGGFAGDIFVGTDLATLRLVAGQ